MADDLFQEITQLTTQLQQSMESTIGEELSEMKYEADKVNLGTNAEQGWTQSAEKLTQKANEIRQQALNLPAEIAKKVDDIFGKVLPGPAADMVKQMVMPKLQAATEKMTAVINQVNPQDILYGQGLQQITEATDGVKMALAESGETSALSGSGSGQLFDNFKQKLSGVLTDNPAVMLGALGPMKDKLGDAMQQINSASATVMASFNQAISVMDEMGVTGNLGIDTGAMTTFVTDIQSQLQELEKATVMMQVDMSSKGIPSPANESKFNFQIQDILSKLELPTDLNNVMRVNQFKQLPKLGTPLKEAATSYDETAEAIQTFEQEFEKLDTTLPGNNVGKQQSGMYREFRGMLSGLQSELSGTLGLLKIGDDPVQMSSRAKALGLSGSIAQSTQGSVTPEKLNSTFTQQKNLFKSLEPVASSIMPKIKNTVASGQFIGTAKGNMNPAKVLTPGNPEYSPQGAIALDQMKNLLDTSTVRNDLSTLQTSLKGFETKVGRFEGGGLAGSLLKTEMQGVVQDAQTVVQTSSEFLQDLDGITAPMTKDFTDMRNELKSVGDETAKSLMDKGKFNSLLTATWDSLKKTNDITATAKEIRDKAKELYAGDLSRIDATLVSLEQYVDRTRKAGKNIETEFNNRVSRVTGVVERRTLRMKQMKAAYDTIKAMSDIVKARAK